MKRQRHSLKWANHWLISQGYTIEGMPELVVSSPWSTVWRITTTNGVFYLKQTPAALSIEAKIIALLSAQCNASVAQVLAANDELHCFLMKDAGSTLREHLNSNFNQALLGQAIHEFSAMQRSAEQHIESFLALGVPDWRLYKFPDHYERIINQTDLLISEGLTETEIKHLHALLPQLTDLCERLSRYRIPETIVQPDFNTNNVLIDPQTQQLTFIDLGELAISHPFFSLHNFLFQAIKHHGVEVDPCIEPAYTQALLLSKKLWPLYGVLAYERLMRSVDGAALKAYYAHRPSQLAASLREYIHI